MQKKKSIASQQQLRTAVLAETTAEMSQLFSPYKAAEQVWRRCWKQTTECNKKKDSEAE